MALSIPSISRINPQARMLIFIGALVNFGGSFYYVALSVYLSIAGFNPTIIGLLLATESVVGFALAIPMAMLSDIHGRKPFTIIGIFMASIAGLILFFTLNLALLFLAATFSGVANALLGAPTGALLAEKAVTDSERNDVFTLWSFFSGIANGFGALISGIIPALFQSYFAFSAVFSFRPLFALSGILGLVGMALVQLKVSESRRERKKEERNGRMGSFIKIPRKSWPIVVRFSVLGLIGFGAGLVLPLFPLWFHLRFSLDISVIGPLFSAMIFVTAIGSLFTPALARRRGSVATIVFTQISSIPLLLFIPFASDYLLAGAAMVARNLLMNVSGPIQNSYQMGVIYPDERATSLSIINTFDAVPRAFAPALGGFLFSLGLLNLPFFIMAALYTASIVGFYFMFKDIKPLESVTLVS